jgi:CDGSH-type Zn-finger protein
MRPCGDGPVLVRDADVVVTADGEAHPTTRPVVAVCTCARSQRMPWCDSTHKAVRREAVSRGEATDAATDVTDGR